MATERENSIHIATGRNGYYCPLTRFPENPPEVGAELECWEYIISGQVDRIDGVRTGGPFDADAPSQVETFLKFTNGNVKSPHIFIGFLKALASQKFLSSTQLFLAWNDNNSEYLNFRE